MNKQLPVDLTDITQLRVVSYTLHAYITPNMSAEIFFEKGLVSHGVVQIIAINDKLNTALFSLNQVMKNMTLLRNQLFSIWLSIYHCCCYLKC